jgi:hypothetical protein
MNLSGCTPPLVIFQRSFQKNPCNRFNMLRDMLHVDPLLLCVLLHGCVGLHLPIPMKHCFVAHTKQYIIDMGSTQANALVNLDTQQLRIHISRSM